MTTRPILFSGPMVRAVLAGRKTQTRRVVKIPMHAVPAYARSWKHNGWCFYGEINGGHMSVPFICPIGKVGDRLWVRETWQTGMTAVGPQIAYAAECDSCEINAWDGPDHGAGPSFNYEKCQKATWHTWLPDLLSGKEGSWRPSIHMPRWASRITLEITDVRVERLQNISDLDAVCEGFRGQSVGGVVEFAGDQFAELWDSIYSKRGHGWSKNPWVWVIEFKQVKP